MICIGDPAEFLFCWMISLASTVYKLPLFLLTRLFLRLSFLCSDILMLPS